MAWAVLPRGNAVGGTIMPLENQRRSRNEATVTSAAPQASAILACLGQAAFTWDLASDAMAWTDHLASVFPDIPAHSLSTGSEFAKLIEPTRSIRSDALGGSSAV